MSMPCKQSVYASALKTSRLRGISATESSLTPGEPAQPTCLSCMTTVRTGYTTSDLGPLIEVLLSAAGQCLYAAKLYVSKLWGISVIDRAAVALHPAV